MIKFLDFLSSWVWWFFHGAEEAEDTAAKVSNLRDRATALEDFKIEASAVISKVASDLYDERKISETALAELRADYDKQLADLRTIIVAQGKNKSPEVKVARRMSEVRAFLRDGDEDAA